MKIVLTGGGSGGHFYPVVSVAEAIKEVSKEYRLVPPELFYVAPEPYNEGILYDHGIAFRRVAAGKRRIYFAPLANFFDIFKTIAGTIRAISVLFNIYPDVVFGKGGYGSFPVLLAAKFLRIPVVIHESDTVPGRVNKWAGKFAKRIAISYPESAALFPQKKVAFTGNPIRQELIEPLESGAFEFLQLEKGIPVIVILGGSLGSQTINNAVIDALPELVERFQIVHQTGKLNQKDIAGRAEAVLFNNKYKDRYKTFDYLSTTAIRMAAGAANVIISRAGSTIFEIATWGVPSIIIPITNSQGNHQIKNAFAYARTGACTVIEEANLTPNIIISETRRIIENPALREKMRSAAKGFAKTDAARTIAKEVLALGLKHEL